MCSVFAFTHSINKNGEQDVLVYQNIERDKKNPKLKHLYNRRSTPQ